MLCTIQDGPKRQRPLAKRQRPLWTLGAPVYITAMMATGCYSYVYGVEYSSFSWESPQTPPRKLHARLYSGRKNSLVP